MSTPVPVPWVDEGERSRLEVARRSEGTTRLAGEWSAYVALHRERAPLWTLGGPGKGPAAGRCRVRYRSASGKTADRRPHDRVDCCFVPCADAENRIPERNRIAPPGFEPGTSRL